MTRTRFAPSPTGYVHIASLQKVLYSYALAKNQGGQYIIRVEDTDQKRFVADAEKAIFDGHELMGIQIDESPIHGGNYGPYRQSERLEIYREYALELVKNGHAYFAFETAEELEKMRKAQTESGQRPHYDGTYRDYPLDEAQKRVASGEKAVIRLKVPKDQDIVIEDMIMGKIKFNTNDVDDYVLLKSDGYPTYHLAVVVDDHLMHISHIFRGVEWISTSPIHVLLYQYFGWKMPYIAHIPNILDPNGGKLSKRNGSVALMEFLEQGYLPEAIINFIILLGWSPSNIERVHGQKEREMFSLEEFIQLFQTKDLNKSNPIFNREKLIWFNKEYIKSLDTDKLTEKFFAWVDRFEKNNELYEHIKSDTNLGDKLVLVKERSKTWKEMLEQLKFFYKAPSEIDWNIKQLEAINSKNLLETIKKKIHELINSFDHDSTKWTHENWEAGMRGIGDELDVKHGDVFMVLRLAVVGSPFSPSLFECLQILGKTEVLDRLN